MPSARRYLQVSAATVRDAIGWYGGRPSSANTYLALRSAHRATAGRSSQLARAVLARLPGAVDHVPRRDRPVLSPSDARAVAEVRRDGIAVIDPVLAPAQVQALVDFARRAPGTVRRLDGGREPGTFVDRPADAAALQLDGAFVWARPEVQSLLVDERLRAIATAATGFRPVLQPPQLYWTFAAPVAPNAQVEEALARGFHWDYDGIAGIRLHVYLTDVDEGAGPMGYVAESHRPGAIGWHRPGSIAQIERSMSPTRTDLVRDILGPAGTTFLDDPQGLHRGNRPTTTDRLFLFLPMQGGSFGGYYHRRRALPVRSEALRDRLAASDPTLRLFEAAPDEAVAASLVGR